MALVVGPLKKNFFAAYQRNSMYNTNLFTYNLSTHMVLFMLNPLIFGSLQLLSSYILFMITLRYTDRFEFNQYINIEYYLYIIVKY